MIHLFIANEKSYQPEVLLELAYSAIINNSKLSLENSLVNKENDALDETNLLLTNYRKN